MSTGGAAAGADPPSPAVEPLEARDPNAISIDRAMLAPYRIDWAAWYDVERRAPPLGITFMIRAKNEEANIERCIASIQEHIRHLTYEIVLVVNDTQDKTRERARALLFPPSDATTTPPPPQYPNARPHRMFEYPWAMAKTGVEHFVTPPSSVHSMVYMYEYAMTRGTLSHNFRWDADFAMTPEFAAALEALFGAGGDAAEDRYDLWYATCTDDDGGAHRERYLVSVRHKPFSAKCNTWEECCFPTAGRVAIIEPNMGTFRHCSSLSVCKPHYLQPPWWRRQHQHLALAQRVAQKHADIDARIPAEVQRFTRAGDHKIVHHLPLTYAEYIEGLPLCFHRDNYVDEEKNG